MQTVKLSANQADDLVVVGSVAYDTIETPFAKGEYIMGGSASYASLAASYFAPSRLVGVVGHDFAEQDRDRLRRHNVDTEGLQVDDRGKTFFWAGRYLENFNERETLETQLNVFEKFDPQLPASYRDVHYVLLANIGPDLQNRVLDQITGKPFVVADTMNLWIDIMREELERLMKRVDLLVVNDSEAEQLTDTRNVIVAGERLRQMGPKSVIVKKGEHGACLFHDDGLFMLPAYPVTDLQDPTGAGDSFVGALTASLAAMRDSGYQAIKRGMLYATVTASFTVEAFGIDQIENAGARGIEDRAAALQRIIRID